MIKTIHNFEEVIDFAWELSQNKTHASYPRKKSVKEMKRAIEKAISEENENIIAYYDEGVLCGVCIYFWKSDEKYAQTVEFLIRGDYDKVAEDFLMYISNELPGYELLIGVPFTNNNANKYFKKKNIDCIESSIVTNLYNLKPQLSEKLDCIDRINKDNFEEYAKFHDKYAIPLGIYFNSKNLNKVMDRFQVLVFRKDGEIHGSIFTKAGKDLSDVIGLFIDQEYKNKGIEGILINEMLRQLYDEFGSIQEILYFIDENNADELNLVLNAGFKIKENYRCYKCIL
jgi:ribosomal protein S18 acetylase RimI-like enzyme